MLLHKAFRIIHRINYFLKGRNVIVFYGSQTGTAEEFANRLAKDCNRYGMKGMAADPEEFDMVSNQRSLI